MSKGVVPVSNSYNTGFLAGTINQDATHGFRGGAEEMAATIPPLIAGTDQPQPGFVDESGGLQRLPRLFLSHLRRRELAQFLIDQR